MVVPWNIARSTRRPAATERVKTLADSVEVATAIDVKVWRTAVQIP